MRYKYTKTNTKEKFHSRNAFAKVGMRMPKYKLDTEMWSANSRDFSTKSFCPAGVYLMQFFSVLKKILSQN